MTRKSKKSQTLCPDCGVPEGAVHTRHCDQEACPFCGWQLLSCDCKYHHLQLFDATRYGAETAYLPPEIYTGGLSEAHQAAWESLLATKGLVPYILYPNMCARCGKLWPAMFHVHDEQWEHYIQLDQRGQMLCRPCYTTIKRLIDTAAQEDEESFGPGNPDDYGDST